MNKKKIIIASAIGLAIVGWAAFRPELLFVNQKVNEAAPVDARVIRTGEFATAAHETGGRAEVFESKGKYVLRLSNFKTSNGPDVRVLLVKGDVSSDDVIKAAKPIDLGSIKGNVGDQNYDLPAGFDPKGVDGVSIWCKRFGVNFGFAKLN